MIEVKGFKNVLTQVVASGATKESPTRIYHTWYGWVTKDVLHVTSSSGAKRRNIWHFGIEKNAGRNIAFKNTTSTADCWTMFAGENNLERFVLQMNPLARIEYVDEINHILFSRGTDCSHQTERGHAWWYITTDGEQQIVRQSAVVGSHLNQYHRSCPTGPDDVLVSGGKYAVNWRNKHRIAKVLVSPGADIENVIVQIKVQRELWDMLDYDDRLIDKELKTRRLELLELAAQGELNYSFVERLTRSVKYYNKLAEEVSPQLYDRVMAFHPGTLRRRRLTDRIVSIISDGKTFDFHLASNKQAGEMILVLPKGEEIDWNGNKSDTKVSDLWPFLYSGYVISLPEWAIESIAKKCESTPLFELEHLPDNIAMANDLVIVIYREKWVLLKNGRNPNAGFGRVRWNPWYLV